MIVTEECTEYVACFFPCGKFTAVEIGNRRSLAEIALNLRLEHIILVAVGFVSLNAIELFIRLCFSEKLVFLGNGNVLEEERGENLAAVFIGKLLCCFLVPFDLILVNSVII